MGFVVEVRARKRRGLLRRSVDAREVGARLGRLAKRMLRDELRETRRDGERIVLELALHPAEPETTLALEPDGDLVLRAETSFVGPAYAARAREVVAPLLEELDYAWAAAFDLAATQQATCAWVAETLRNAAPGRVDLGVERPFVVDAPVLTPLGPRDAAWRDAVLADPRHARDMFAWWDVGPGCEARATALLAMWNEIAWRDPLDKTELALMKRVTGELRAAHRADPELELPWPEWAALLDWLGSTSELADEVRERAGGKPATIGYRRYDLDVELAAGWCARLPAAFVSGWEDEGERFWATDGARSLELTTLTAQDSLDSAALLAVAPERHPVIDRFVDGAHHGRAEAYDSDGVRVVIGLVARAPHVAILTCKGAAAAEPWALATWRSLRNDG